MDEPEISAFAGRVRQHLFGHLLPFWTGPALDHEHGGWLPWMSNDLRVDRSQPKGLIVNTRLLWTFSAVHRVRPEELYRSMAERACRFVLERFWDAEHGGAFWRLDSSGQVLDNSKKIYGQAFCIYALAEYFRAFDTPVALRKATELFELLERHAHDPVEGGYWEVRRSDWSEATDTRLSEKDMNEKKSMNNHLHLLEAYTNLCRIWRDSRLITRLRELIQLFERRILSPARHLHHFFNEHWQPRSRAYTYGHDIEGSWLLCEAAEVLGDADQLGRVRSVALLMAGAVLEQGFDAEGGLYYEGQDGRVIDQGKEWWPQAEAVVGFLNAFQLSGQARYFKAALQIWDFIEARLADREHGEWFWRINPDGKPDSNQPKVSEWKGPYHGVRACLETLRRLDQIGGASRASGRN